MSAESPASVEQILSAFGDEGYWHARLAEFTGGTAALDSLATSADGAVTVRITVGLLGDRLPKVVTQLHRGDLKMVRAEEWRRDADGRVHGEIDVAIPGAPLTAKGQGLLVAAGSGSRMSYTTTVTVRVPVVGGKIESYICGQTLDEISRVQRFTDQWIAENS